MLAWATKFCLFPDDEVYIVHCLSKVSSSVLRTLILPLAVSCCVWPVSFMMKKELLICDAMYLRQHDLPGLPECAPWSDEVLSSVQSLMKLSNKKGNEVGPEIVEDIEREQVNVVSNTQLKVRPSSAVHNQTSFAKI